MKIYVKATVKDVFEEDPQFRRNLILDRNTDMRTLMQFADDPDANNRAYLAELTRTTPEVLAKLADDSEARVRRCVARNPNTPEDALVKLARDPDFTVRHGLATRLYDIPDDVLIALLEPADQRIDSEILIKMVRRQLFPGVKVYEKLAESPDLYTRQAIAMDMGDLTPDSVLVKLMDDPDESVRAGVVTYRENLPVEVIDKAVVDPFVRVRAGVARDAIMREDQYELLANDPEPRVRKSVALNPHTPLSIKQKLAHDEDESVRDLARKQLDKVRERN